MGSISISRDTSASHATITLSSPMSQDNKMSNSDDCLKVFAYGYNFLGFFFILQK